MKTNFSNLCTAVLAAAMCLPAAAANLVQNGGFESGLSAWTTLDQTGSDGMFSQQTGSTSPLNGLPVAPPPEGSFAAMTDAAAGGSHVLYQDILIPTDAVSGSVMFSLYWNNDAVDFYTPPHLDWAQSGTPDMILNQRARVDIVNPNADPFSLQAADILLNLFETAVGAPPQSGYNTYQVNIGGVVQAFQGQTIRLRFAEVDNVSLFNFGVDDVQLETAPIPEPGTWTLTLAALGVAVLLGRRR